MCYANERLPFRWVERTQQQGCWHVGCCRLVEFPLVVAGCKMVYQGDITTHLMEWHDYCTLKVKSAPSMPYYLLYTRLLKSCIKPCGLIFLVTNNRYCPGAALKAAVIISESGIVSPGASYRILILASRPNIAASSSSSFMVMLLSSCF